MIILPSHISKKWKISFLSPPFAISLFSSPCVVGFCIVILFCIVLLLLYRPSFVSTTCWLYIWWRINFKWSKIVSIVKYFMVMRMTFSILFIYFANRQSFSPGVFNTFPSSWNVFMNSIHLAVNLTLCAQTRGKCIRIAV